MNPSTNTNGAVETPPVKRGITAHEQVQEEIARPAAPSQKGMGGRLLLGVIVALVVVGVILWQRSRAFAELAESTKENAVPTVAVTTSKTGAVDADIVLPGNVTAFSDTSIYARTNGYVKAWYTNIGDKVTAGQLMAEIEAPDVDAQMRQATANLSQAQANMENARLNFERTKDLLQKKVVSQQEFDQAKSTFDALQASVKASEANVQNLTVQQGFQKITAPFDGVVTRRNTDVGALINAGSTGSTTANAGAELFHIARTDVLRVFVNVPQVYSAQIAQDTQAWLEIAEFSGTKFQGKVAHIAGAIDPATRTLQTEIQVPNADGQLFPGAFGNVHLTVKLKNAPAVIPLNTIIFRGDGTQVGVVDENNIVHLKKVALGRDFGTTLEVTGGLDPKDRLILNPSDSLAEGMKVHVQENPPVDAAKSTAAK